MLSSFKNCELNNDEKPIVNKIVSSLIKYEIKTYMTDYYNENDDSRIIDLIFNNIIFKHFEKEYHQITQYVDKSNLSLEYGEKVFNTNDLMCLIFQFSLKNIISIGLVCSQWLYYSYDKKSHIFNSNLPFRLLKKISMFNPKNEAKHQLERYKSQLQRLYNVQSLNIDLPVELFVHVVTSQLLSHLAVFKNVQQLEICFGDTRKDAEDNLKVLKVIVEQCGHQITQLKISPGQIHRAKLKLPALRLNNVESIFMFVECFPIIFSNKLKSLTIGFKKKTTRLNHDVIKLIIDKCDCSNIKHLKIYNVLFNNICLKNNYYTHLRSRDSNHNYKRDKDGYDEADGADKGGNLIKQFASKFIALETIDFVLEKCTCLSINLWNTFIKSLKLVFLKNQTLITSDALINQLQNVNVTLCKSGRRVAKKSIKARFHDVLNTLQSNPCDDYRVTYDEFDIRKWNVVIYGPQGTPYENGLFDMQLELTHYILLLRYCSKQ